MDRLLARCADSAAIGKTMSSKRREKFARYQNQIERCGEDVRALQRFTAAQRIAFHKILKKYKVCSGRFSTVPSQILMVVLAEMD